MLLRFPFLCVAIGLAVIGRSACAMSAAQLAEACRSASPVCEAYIAGVLDTRSSFLEWHYLIDEIFCGQDKLAVGQVRDALMNYVTKHPQRQNDLASATLLRALNELHPCP